jgi:hypothetical protein
MSDLQTPLLLAGIACIVAAVVGGGLKLLGAEFPLLQSFTRQVLLAVAGAVLIVVSVVIPSAADTQRAEDRAALATSFSQRLDNVGTELNRVRSGQPPPEGFFRGNELVPLTDIWNDLYGSRVRLGEDLYTLLIKKARLVLRFANEGNTHELLQEFTIVNDALTKEIASQ